jgi:hypothetical protein
VEQLSESPVKYGRKFVELNENQLREIMRFHPTIEDTAAFFEVSISKIEKYIREKWDVTFSVFRDQNMVHTRFNLIRTAIAKAEKGDNVMLIFCLKNLCNWRDKPPDEVADMTFRNMSTQELIVLVKQKIPEIEAAK